MENLDLIRESLRVVREDKSGEMLRLALTKTAQCPDFDTTPSGPSELDYALFPGRFLKP